MLERLQAKVPGLPNSIRINSSSFPQHRPNSPSGRFSATFPNLCLHHVDKCYTIAVAQETYLGAYTENTDSEEVPLRKLIGNTGLTDSYHAAELLRSPERLSGALSQLHPPFYHGDYVFLANLLRFCGTSRTLHQGRFIHSHIIRCDLNEIIFLQNLLIQTYGKCGAVDDAHALFTRMHLRDPYSWNFMVSTCTQNAQWNLALEVCNQSQMEGIATDGYVLSSILSAYAGSEALLQGKHIHACLPGTEYERLEAVGNALINLYGRCDCLPEAWTVFTKMAERSVISWSSMITVYTQHDHGKEALWLWSCMQHEAVTPNRATIVGALDACANQAVLLKVLQIQCCILGSPLESDGMVMTTLINAYGKCGDMDNALRAFEQLREPNVVSWTAIMAGYAQHGHGKEAFEIFDKMQRNGVVPNKITYVCILGAYEGNEHLEKAKQMHACIKHIGFDSDVVVATAIVNMYGRCGSTKNARMIFDEMPERNLVTWNTMLSIYAQHGHGQNAFDLFTLMLQNRDSLNEITFISMLSVCASEEALIEGNWMHDQVVRHGYHRDIVVGNAIVNMYGKCGQVEQARNSFDRLSGRTVVSWSSMIAAYAQHGHGKEILPMLQRMKREGVPPNLLTFKAILSACSHAGLVEDAHACLKSMSELFQLKPDGEHYDCVVDLLGRTGRLDEVEKMITGMPMQPTLVSWMMLLGACSSQADLERGKRVANKIFEMYPDSPAPYIILSNMYVDVGKDTDAERILGRMKAKGLMKRQDCSYIEVDGKVHEFSSSNRSLVEADLVYPELRRLNRMIDFKMLVEDTTTLHLLKDNNKHCGTCHHTVRLAIGFGFLSSHPKDTLFITNGVQMCSQCHRFAEIISSACNRQIVISDLYQIHRMQEGFCSCAAQG